MSSFRLVSTNIICVTRGPEKNMGAFVGAGVGDWVGALVGPVVGRLVGDGLGGGEVGAGSKILFSVNSIVSVSDSPLTPSSE